MAWERARTAKRHRAVVIVADTDEFTVDESWLSAAPPSIAGLLVRALAAYEKALIEDALRSAADACSGRRERGPARIPRSDAQFSKFGP